MYDVIAECQELLSDEPLFFLVNSYTSGFSSVVAANILECTVKKQYGGKVSYGEVGLKAASSGLILPCGIYGRWEA